MLVAVIHEIWPWPDEPGSTPKAIIGPIGADEGYAAARSLAENRASEFDKHGLDGERDFWWGHNEGELEYHRFIFKAP